MPGGVIVLTSHADDDIARTKARRFPTVAAAFPAIVEWIRDVGFVETAKLDALFTGGRVHDIPSLMEAVAEINALNIRDDDEPDLPVCYKKLTCFLDDSLFTMRCADDEDLYDGWQGGACDVERASIRVIFLDNVPPLKIP